MNTASGETGLQNGVQFTGPIAGYSNATARQYLIDVYGWSITEGGLRRDGNIVGDQGANTIDASLLTTAYTLHGLGGNDTFIGTNGDDNLYGGAGNDILTGGAGADTFHYLFTNAGSDTITDFNAGQGDRIDISVLLDGYGNANYGTSLSDFVTVSSDAIAESVTITIDADGRGAGTATVSITLTNLEDYTALDTVQELIDAGAFIYQ